MYSIPNTYKTGFKGVEITSVKSSLPNSYFRTGSMNAYLYGFNGMERDDEVKGGGNSYDFKYRMHDARLGRFLSIDPLSRQLPWNSTYSFAENRVMDGIDFEGLEHLHVIYIQSEDGGYQTYIEVIDEKETKKLVYDITIRDKNGDEQHAYNRKTSFNDALDESLKDKFYADRKDPNTGKRVKGRRTFRAASDKDGNKVIEVYDNVKGIRKNSRVYVGNFSPQWVWVEPEVMDILDSKLLEGYYSRGSDTRVIDAGQISIGMDKVDEEIKGKIAYWSEVAKKKGGKLIVGEINRNIHVYSSQGVDGTLEQHEEASDALESDMGSVASKSEIIITNPTDLSHKGDGPTPNKYSIEIYATANWKIVKKSRKTGKWVRKE